jgi:hypothetical protein
MADEVTLPYSPGRLTERAAPGAVTEDPEWTALIDKHWSNHRDVLRSLEDMIESAGAALPDPDTPLTLTRAWVHGLKLAIATLEVQHAALAELAGDRRRALEARVQELEGRPALRYRGVWAADVGYQEANIVTWAGGLWICHSPTATKPGGADWQLIVKGGQR